jgi:hypothetical protein
MLAAPSLWLLWRVVDVNSPEEVLALALITWWFVLSAIRILLYTIPGRLFGYYDLLTAATWLRWTALPWRPFFLFDTGNRAFGLRRLLDWWRLIRGGRGANRAWAGPLEVMSYVFRPGDRVLAGRFSWHRIPFFQPIGLPGGGKHTVLVGAPGTGKSLHLMTMLATLHLSVGCFVVDCDGAFTNALAAEWQRAGIAVAKLDADGMATGFAPQSGWEPLYEITVADLRHGRASVVAFAERLAQALIVQDSQSQPVFANASRVFIKALLLYVWLVDDDKSLARVRVLLTTGLPERVTDPREDPFERLLFEMSALPARYRDGRIDDGCNGEIYAAIAAGAGAMTSRAEKGNEFRRTLVYQTAWLDDPNIRAMMARPSITVEDIKFKGQRVLLVATLSDIQTRMAPYIRAFCTLALYSAERTPEYVPKIPSWLFIDEAASTRMEALATAAPTCRKYGYRIVIATQSLQLMRAAYPNHWREFFSTAQCVLWFGLDDPGDTLKFLSEEMLGRYLRKEVLDGTPWWKVWVPRASRVRGRPQWVERPLMDARQCAEYLDPASGHIIVTRFGRRPMRLKQVKPFRELPVWKYAVHQGYGESVFRALTRRGVTRLRQRKDARTAAAHAAKPVDFPTALQVFGLSEPYTLPEVDRRHEVLMAGAAAQASAAYRSLVERAREALIDARLREGSMA